MLDIRESVYDSDYCTTCRITNVTVTSDTVDEVVKWANSTADPYCITLMYSFKDLNFLLEIPSLKRLYLTQYLVTDDMSAVEKCTNLFIIAEEFEKSGHRQQAFFLAISRLLA